MINNLLFDEGMPEMWIHESATGENRKRKRLKASCDAHLFKHPLGIMFETKITHRGILFTLSEVGIEVLVALDLSPKRLSYQVHPWNKEAAFDLMKAELKRRDLL
jgi:hypothetical protein